MPFQLNHIKIFSVAIASVVASLFLGSCSNSVRLSEAVAADGIYRCDSFALYPDRFVEGALTVIARSPRLIVCDKSPALGWNGINDTLGESMPVYESDQPLVDALFNRAMAELADSTVCLKEHEVHSLWLAENYLLPNKSRHKIEERIKNGIFESESQALPWPISSDRNFWTVTAEDLSNILGDSVFSSKVFNVACKTFERDIETCFNTETGLVNGSQTYMLPQPPLYPEWMGQTDIYQSPTLGSNVALVAAAHSLARMACQHNSPSEFYDSVASKTSAAITSSFMQPNLGYFSAYQYCYPYPVQLQATDNMAQGLGVVHNIFSPQIAKRVVAMSPVFPTGIPTFFPMPRAYRYDAEKSLRPMVQAFAAIAAASTANEHAQLTNTAFTLRQAIVSPDCKKAASSVAAIVFREFAGMRFTPKGIKFTPSVPNAFPGIKRIRNFNYRNANLNILISGAGDSIASFAIDGRLQTHNLFPADMSGRHSVEIRLKARHAVTQGRVSESDLTFMPATPRVHWTTPRHALIVNTFPNYDYQLLVNGQFQTMMLTDSYNMFSSDSYTTVSFVPVINSMWTGFASAPHEYFPKGTRFSFPVKNNSVNISTLPKGEYMLWLTYRASSFSQQKIILVNVGLKEYTGGATLVLTPDKNRSSRTTLSITGKHNHLHIIGENNKALHNCTVEFVRI